MSNQELELQFVKLLVARSPFGLSDEEIQYFLDHPQELGRRLENPLYEPTSPTIMTRARRFDAELENKYYRQFLGQSIEIPDINPIIAKYNDDQWEAMTRLCPELHFLPAITFLYDSMFPGWKIRIHKAIWEGIYENPADDHYLRPCRWGLYQGRHGHYSNVRKIALSGKFVLIDSRKKPDLEQGLYEFADDEFLSGLIDELRQNGKLQSPDHVPQKSRFGINSNNYEYGDIFHPALAAKLGLDPNQIRLETIIESSVIPQIYLDMPRCQDLENNTGVWLDNIFMTEHFNLRYVGSNTRGSEYYTDITNYHYDGSKTAVRFIIEL